MTLIFLFMVLILGAVFIACIRDINRPHWEGNQFSVEVLADSLSPGKTRLTTLMVTFPRFILAEFNTHRVLSRNSASSRAIPIKKQIRRVIYRPFVPIGFGGAQGGMVAAEDLIGWKANAAKQIWLKSRWAAVVAAFALDRLGVHKAFANRVLEPWLWHTVIVTSTDWDNFLALRTDAAAQPEFRRIAEMIQMQLALSKPRLLGVGDWHLPMVTPTEVRQANTFYKDIKWPAAMVSAGRCARVSFDTHTRSEGLNKSIDRAGMLTKNGHWSPTEHQAQVAINAAFAFPSNLSGDWNQFRKMFENEDNFAAVKETL